MPDAATSDGVGVLDRMTSILEAFDQDDGGLGVSELALRAGLPKSTVSRLVTKLVQQGYLERDGNRIHLGLRLFELGQLAEQPRELREAALPVMAVLRTTTGESVQLAVRDRREMVCIAALRARSAPPPSVRIGGRLPIHATALGKALLAHAPLADLEEVVSSGLERWTAETITDPAALRRQLDDVRRRGLATDAGEFALGVSCAAIAVSTPSGILVGAVSVSGRTEDVDAERVAPALRAAALTLRRRLTPRRPGVL
jgi:DNA-binding IclR family transcriptional regulator